MRKTSEVQIYAIPATNARGDEHARTLSYACIGLRAHLNTGLGWLRIARCKMQAAGRSGITYRRTEHEGTPEWAGPVVLSLEMGARVQLREESVDVHW